MKLNTSLARVALSTLMVFLVITAGETLARQTPDLRVQLQGPTTAYVKSPYVYTVTVTNIGNGAAAGVNVSITLPVTDTSPQKYVLGTLSGIDGHCQLVALKLQCPLGSLGANRQIVLSFTLALPVSTKVLAIKADASTTTPNETNPSNNTATLIPNLGYATNALASANVLVTHCTGQGLTAFYECECFPGSTQQFEMTLNPDHSITIPGYSGYTGTWDQASSSHQLHFAITETGSNSGVEFSGFATTNTCFEGMATFMPASPYVSPYKVCVQ